MAWKLRIALGRPTPRIVWDNVFYRTYLEVDGQKYDPGSEVRLNILTNPTVRLSVVGENVGDSGKIWILLVIRNSIGDILPLFVKQDTLEPGDIIVADVSYSIDKAFFDFITNYLGIDESYTIDGYVGVGDLSAGIEFPIESSETGRIVRRVQLPFAFIRDLTGVSNVRAMPVESREELIKVITNMMATQMSVFIEQPVIDIRTIEPVSLKSYGIEVRASEAGFNFYDMLVINGEYFRTSGVEEIVRGPWVSVLVSNSADSTKNYDKWLKSVKGRKMGVEE